MEVEVEDDLPATIHFMPFSVLTGIRAIENMRVEPNEGTNSE